MIETFDNKPILRADGNGWAVSAGALALAWLGGNLPLPGLSPDALALPEASGHAKLLSVFALGVTPILASCFLIELARILIPPVARASPGRVRIAARGLALVLAAFQASSVGAAAQRIPGLVDDPGPLFRAEVVAAMVGATAVLLVLAQAIDRRGVGDGLLLLFAGQTLASVVRLLALLVGLVRLEQVEPSAPWVWIASVVVAGALAAFAAREKGVWRGLNPWPPLLAFGFGSVLPGAALLVCAMIGAPIEAVSDWLTSACGRTALAVLTAALYGLFALMLSGSERLDAQALAAQLLVVFGGGMLWLVSPFGGSTSGCAFLLFAAAVTSLVARGQPRLGFE